MSEQTESRSRYKHFLQIATRWQDNDSYGHVNNVVYYSYFDTVVNEYLIRAGGLDIQQGSVIGIVAETLCRFHKSVSFPALIDVGMRVAGIGHSSVRYEIAIFRLGEDEPAASGHFVHVFVQREAHKPTAIPERIRACLEGLV